MRFVAAEAGFFPPGPLTLLADIIERGNEIGTGMGQMRTGKGNEERAGIQYQLLQDL